MTTVLCGATNRQKVIENGSKGTHECLFVLIYANKDPNYKIPDPPGQGTHDTGNLRMLDCGHPLNLGYHAKVVSHWQVAGAWVVN